MNYVDPSGHVVITAGLGALIGGTVGLLGGFVTESINYVSAKKNVQDYDLGRGLLNVANATVTGVVGGTVAGATLNPALAGAAAGATGGFLNSLTDVAYGVTQRALNGIETTPDDVEREFAQGTFLGALGYGVNTAVNAGVNRWYNSRTNTSISNSQRQALQNAQTEGCENKSGKTTGKVWDYSKQFDGELANFNAGYEIKNVIDEDLYLVQFHSNAEVGSGRSLKYWTTFDEANGISTVDDYMNQMALLSNWGARDNVSIAKIPAGTKIKYAIGTAKEQIGAIESRHGGGLQILFEQFDDGWVLDTRPLP